MVDNFDKEDDTIHRRNIPFFGTIVPAAKQRGKKNKANSDELFDPRQFNSGAALRPQVHPTRVSPVPSNAAVTSYGLKK
jgi:hypothetical protein